MIESGLLLCIRLVSDGTEKCCLDGATGVAIICPIGIAVADASLEFDRRFVIELKLCTQGALEVPEDTILLTSVLFLGSAYSD